MAEKVKNKGDRPHLGQNAITGKKMPTNVNKLKQWCK